MKIKRKEVDMHTHSTHSDGRNDVSGLFWLVNKANLKAAVLTDHDRIGGLKEFMDSCVNNGIDSMTGIEISSTDTTSHPQTIDVLGYGFNGEILLRDYNQLLEHNLNARIGYVKKVLELFKEKGVADFTVERLRTHFNLPAEVANKYWLIALRVNELIISVKAPEALEIARKELKKGGCFFVEREHYISTKEAINAIRRSGGVAIWAHPTKTMEKLKEKYENPKKIFYAILDRMVSEGLDGIEVYTPYGDTHRKFLLNCANQKKLIITGGSDYHGEYGLIKDDFLGKEGVSYKEFLEIKKRICCLK
ncbi:MAG: Phosphotransferase [Parcubacteria group bacterium]|nr:Phosphotransferase [Parcubacteria group bacterium]